MEIAKKCRSIIESAEADNLTIDEGNVIDLLADNITDCSLSDLRGALAVSGLGHRFPSALRLR